MEELIRDLRFSWRQILKTPGFTLAIVACLALGIGANAATFSFTKSILFPPTHIQEPERLVRLFVERSSGLKFGSFSYPDYRDLRDRCQAFSQLAVDTPTPLHISLEGRNERFWGSLVSANYFDTLGIEIPRGRGFTAEEEAPGSSAVVILSHGFWQRRFGGDPGAIGRSISLNGHPFTVIGIAPEGFSGSNVGLRSELWVPLAMHQVVIPGSDQDNRGRYWLSYVIGRLRPGVSVAQARSQVDVTMSQLAATYPDTNVGKRAAVYPEEGASLHPMVRGAFMGFLALMFSVVALVLLLACTNVAGLLMARAAVRRREVAIRLALGIGRRRLLRQLLTESTMLALISGILGLLLSLALIKAVQSLQIPIDVPIAIEPRLDWAVLAFTFLVAVLTGILFGLAPALQATRTELVSSLKQGTPGGGSGSVWLRKALVVGQVCLSMILLIGASLALQSFRNANQVRLGFRPDHLLIASVDLDLQRYEEPAGRQFLRNAKERIEALPGVVRVSQANTIPLTLNRQQTPVTPQGFVVERDSSPPLAGYNLVGPDYFETMGISLRQGRTFTANDGADSPPVAVVSQAFAERYWPGESPLGKRLSAFKQNFQVVGMVEDGKYFSLGEEPTPYVYLPLERQYRGAVTFVVRTTSDPAPLLEQVRREINQLDAQIPVFNLKSMEDQLGFALLPSRIAAMIITLFAVLALFLSAVGLFAVVSYWVNQRSREIAIRKAIGATIGHILKLVVWQGLSLAIVGLVLGLGIGVALSRLIAGLLYGIDASSPAPFLIAAAALLVVVLFASLLPARRALKVDVIRVMQGE